MSAIRAAARFRGQVKAVPPVRSAPSGAREGLRQRQALREYRMEPFIFWEPLALFAVTCFGESFIKNQWKNQEKTV